LLPVPHSHDVHGVTVTHLPKGTSAELLETKRKRMVCSGKMTLEKTQYLISTNSIVAYKKCVAQNGRPEIDEE
jgi:hypothetical protein